jgi:hypothetical protein
VILAATSMSAFADAPSVEAAPVTEREVRSLCEE